MEITPIYDTGKVIVAKGRLWHNVLITETPDGYAVQDSDGICQWFKTLRAAMAYVETMFSKEA